MSRVPTRCQVPGTCWIKLGSLRDDTGCCSGPSALLWVAGGGAARYPGELAPFPQRLATRQVPPSPPCCLVPCLLSMLFNLHRPGSRAGGNGLGRTGGVSPLHPPLGLREGTGAVARSMHPCTPAWLNFKPRPCLILHIFWSMAKISMSKKAW